MNVQVLRRTSVSNSGLVEEDSVTEIRRIQPAEFNPDVVPYKVHRKRNRRKSSPKKGYCSKTLSNYKAFRNAYPFPGSCSSSAEVLLKSFVEVIRKQQFWDEDGTGDIEEQRRLFSENKERADDMKTITTDLDQTDEDENDSPAVKEFSEVEERRLKLAISNISDKMKVLIECLVLTRIAYGNHSFDYAEALVNLAQAYLDWKGYHQQAINHCKTAKSILRALASSEAVQDNEAILSLVRTTLCRLYFVEGKALIGLKTPEKGENSLAEAQTLLDIVKKIPTISEAHITWFEVRSARAFASLYIAQSRYGQATASVQCALDLEKKNLSAFSSGQDGEKIISVSEKLALHYYSVTKRIAGLYRYLGEIERMRGDAADFQVATRWYKSANEAIFAALETELTPLSPSNEDDQAKEIIDKDSLEELAEQLKLKAVNCHSQISKICLKESRFDKAEGIIKKALDMFEGQSHSTYIKSGKGKVYYSLQDQLAKIYVKSNKHDEAIKLLEGSLPAKRRVFGDFSFSVLETYNLLISLHLVKSNVDEAVKFLKKFGEVSTVRYGKTDSRTKNAEMTINMLVSSLPQGQANEKKPPVFKVG